MCSSSHLGSVPSSVCVMLCSPGCYLSSPSWTAFMSPVSLFVPVFLTSCSWVLSVGQLCAALAYVSSADLSATLHLIWHRVVGASDSACSKLRGPSHPQSLPLFLMSLWEIGNLRIIPDFLYRSTNLGCQPLVSLPS